MKKIIIPFIFAFLFFIPSAIAPDVLTLAKNITINATLTGSMNIRFNETCNSANNHSTNCAEMELRSADNTTKYALVRYAFDGVNTEFIANITNTTLNQNITVVMAYNNTTAYTGYRNANDALILLHSSLYNNTNTTRPIGGGSITWDANSNEVKLSSAVSDVDFASKDYNKSFRLEYWFQFSGANGDGFFIMNNNTILNPCNLCRGYNVYNSYFGSPNVGDLRRDDGSINTVIIIDAGFTYDQNPHNNTLTRDSTGLFTLYLDGVSQGTVTDNLYNNITAFNRFAIWQGDTGGTRINNITIMAIGDRSDFMSFGQAYIIGAVTPAVTPTVSFDSPTNTTYLRSNVTLNFTVTGDSATYNCTRETVGNGTTNIGNITNNTYYSESITGLEPTTYNITTSCSGVNGLTGISSRIFSIIHWNITVNETTSRVYETNYTIFRLNVTVAPNINYVNASLLWNGTAYSNSTFNISNNQHGFTRNQTAYNLLVTNNTGVSWYWSFNISYSNGTNINNRTTAEGNQSILFAYTFNYFNISHMNGVFEGENFRVNSTINKVLDFATIRSNLTFNATNVTNSSFITKTSNTFFGYDTTVPLITETSINATFNLTFLITYNGFSRIAYSNTSNLNISRIYLGNCTSGTQTTKIMSFVGKNEEGFANLTVNYSLDATFLVWNNSNTIRNYSFAYTNQTAYDLCVSPATAVLYVNSSMEYSATNFPIRTYHIVNAKIQGTSDNSSVNVINHYLLNDSLASIITFTIKDATGSPISNLYLKLKRYSTATNTYATVQIAKSDFEGKAIVKARLNDAFYQVIVDDGVKVRTSKDAFQIKTTSIPLTIDPKSPIEYFQYYGKIAFSCDYTNSTLTLQCTISDGSNLMTKACLYLYQIGTLSDTLVKKDCSTDSNPTVGYTWASWSDIQGKKFSYKLYVETNADINNQIYLLNRFMELSDVVSTFGITGVFLASMVIFTTSLMGFWSPPMAIMLGITSLTILSITNLISIPLAGIASIIFVGFVFIWRINRK